MMAESTQKLGLICATEKPVRDLKNVYFLNHRIICSGFEL